MFFRILLIAVVGSLVLTAAGCHRDTFRKDQSASRSMMESMCARGMCLHSSHDK